MKKHASTEKPKVLDLFSGIGGFSLAFEAEGFETIAFSEIEPYASAVLKEHWPDIHNYGDITKYESWPDLGPISVLTGGFPCQPFSCAGKRKGAADDRFLWPAMLGVIKKYRPAWVLGENVVGIIDMELEHCLTDLENAGYEVQPLIIPACAVGAPIERDRVWIIASTNKMHGKTRVGHFKREASICPWPRTSSEAVWLQAASEAVGMGYGIPSGSYEGRVSGIGNAIVPQVAQLFAKAIRKQIERDLR